MPSTSQLRRFSRSLARSRWQACRSPRSRVAAPIELARASNRHSARRPAGANLPATSCLDAFWTPAAAHAESLGAAGVQKPVQLRTAANGGRRITTMVHNALAGDLSHTCQRERVPATCRLGCQRCRSGRKGSVTGAPSWSYSGIGPGTSIGAHDKHPEGCPSSAIAGVASGSKRVAAIERSAMRAYLMS
jgi:hypothetical protein